MNLKYIYKIIDNDELKKAKLSGQYLGSSKDIQDGYIHFSGQDQVASTLKKFYSSIDNLILLKIETIESFIRSFVECKKDGAFAVFPKKTFYWETNGKTITNWKGSTIMNTKFVDPVYEAAHCLYASRLDIIKDGFWMDTKSPPEPHLVEMEELEAFDIDYNWQFKTAELLYDNIR